MESPRYKTCKRCGSLVLKSAMADHWIIARHLHSTLLPASADHGDRQRYPAAYVPDVLRTSRRAS